jgi:two-component system phosphate regulon response regulator PhoB
MTRILIIEDEKDIRDVLEYNLKQAGHDVRSAATGKDGMRLARELPPQIVILDLMLPDISGADVCRALKQEATTRSCQVMMLTAKGEEIDRVIGFELGAEDYVVKPFSVRELLLRVAALQRRGPGAGGGSPTEDIAFGFLRVDRAAHRTWVDDREIELTALEFKLLVTLHDRRNRVQTREALLTDVWGLKPDISTRTVDTHVKRLREKLGTDGDYIQTVRGVGYRFAATPDEAREAS